MIYMLNVIHCFWLMFSKTKKIPLKIYHLDPVEFTY